MNEFTKLPQQRSPYNNHPCLYNNRNCTHLLARSFVVPQKMYSKTENERLQDFPIEITSQVRFFDEFFG